MKYRHILNRVIESELKLRLDKKLNKETHLNEVIRILQENNLSYDEIICEESKANYVIRVNKTNFQNWLFENTRSS